MASRLCVRLLSGATVYEGPRPHSLAELRDEVAATMGCKCDELSFCSGDAVLSSIEDVDEQITVVRDEVMGLLGEFLKRARGKLPEHLRPAREHRRLLLTALERDSRAIQHASPELLADRDFVLTAVAISARAPLANECAVLQYASTELRADRDVVLAVVAHNGYALGYASSELRADRDVVLAAVASDGYALGYASSELRADRAVVTAALAQNGHALQHASPELLADRDFVLTAVAIRARAPLANKCSVLKYASPELRADRNVVLAAVASDGYALSYASSELRADQAVVTAALANHALRYAAFKLRAD